jgi:hypothetical protein
VKENVFALAIIDNRLAYYHLIMAQVITSIGLFITISSFQIPKKIHSAYWDAHIQNNTAIYLYFQIQFHIERILKLYRRNQLSAKT